MKILSRLLMVVVLLCSLSYGAYAFGRYVLSAYMFTGVATADQKDVDAVASSTKVADTVTRKTKYTGDAPRVEVEVLPADDAGRAPDVPSLAVLRKEVEQIKPRREDAEPAPKSDNAPPKRVRDIDSVDGADSVRNSGDNDNDKPREPRRRRRSRTRRSTERKPEAVVAVVKPPARSDENSGSSDAGDDAPRERASTNDAPAKVKPPQRVRERAREESPRPRSESPVPRAEGQGSGGESPVPQAE